MRPLNELLIQEAEKLALLSTLTEHKSWDLSPRQLCDLELLMNAGFNPLVGFLNEEDYHSVCHTMRLTTGELWPIPVTLDVNEHFAKSLNIGEQILLRDQENVPLAVLTIASIWKPNKLEEAELIFGTYDDTHPGVHYLFHQAQDWYLGGGILGLQLPTHYDYRHHRHTPNELREVFKQKQWESIVAFQTRNPIHRAHYELTLRAAQAENAKLLLHPVVGITKPGDIGHHTRVRSYEQVLQKYPPNTTLLSLLPLAMRMAGPREALWHALIRQNYGATHFIVGRDHAGPGKDSKNIPFYNDHAAIELVTNHAKELDIKIVPFQAMSYVKNKARYLLSNEIETNDIVLDMSGTELRTCLREHREIPAWFSFPEVIHVLKKAYPPKHQQGLTLFFTGLSGAGKSTLAKALLVALAEQVERPITLLDGDILRKNLSNELSFTKEHRDIHIKRMGYVASEITKHKGIAICAAIAPYANTRHDLRAMIEQYGGFLEIYVSTPLNVCEQRDLKGLYHKARLGLISHFTGIDDPYEEPLSPDIIIDTSLTSVLEAIQKILRAIERLGYLEHPTHQLTP